ncbi:MAG: lysophospholipid acyltransferase family protein [Novosphingobium sp.]
MIAKQLRVAARLTGVAGLLVCYLPFHAACIVARRPSPWPRRFLGGSAWVAGVTVRAEGNMAAAPLLLVANHVSWIDILALGTTGTAFIAHDGLASHPLLRLLCGMNGTVFVARHDRARVGAQAVRIAEALAGTGARGGVLTLFPEGTTGDGRTLLPFKSALLAAVEYAPCTVSVQPVLIDYGAEAAAIAWTGAEPGLGNVLRVLARDRPLEVTLRFLPPLMPGERASRKMMARAARERIASALTADAEAKTNAA